jgi:hypothetical protein
MGKEANENAPVIAMSQDQFAELLKIATAGQSQSPSPELAEAIKALAVMAESGNQKQSMLHDQIKRTTRVSNAEHENISAFTFKPGCQFCDGNTRHPDEEGGKLGHPKPILKYLTFFPKQAPVIADDATVVEVELFNQLGDVMAATPHIPRFARKGTWKAFMSPDGKNLHLDAPHFTSDERNSLPSLPAIITEFLMGQAAVDPDRVFSEMLAMRTRLAALEAQAVPA